MAKFKNIFSESGKAPYNGGYVIYAGIYETKDKDEIKHFAKTTGWIRLDTDAKPKKAKAIKAKSPLLDSVILEDKNALETEAENV